MHFHLSKPVHGWRAFAGEVGIIVLGVLIALSAEQLVENWHWKNEVAAERKSLLQEAADMNSAIAARADQQSCIDRRLGEIRTVLERHQHGQPLGLVGTISAPTGQNATRGTWQIALAGQALAHMGHDEKLAYSDVFGGFEVWDRAMTVEADAWLRLAPLNHPEFISEGDWTGIKSAYAAALVANEHMRVLAPWMLQQDSKQLPEITDYRSVDNLSRFRNSAAQICKPVVAVTSRSRV